MRMQPPTRAPLSASSLARALGTTFRSSHSTARLEAALREMYSADDVILCGSGTQALQLAMESAPPGAIAIPAFGCYDLASALIGAGRQAVFYDIDPATLGPQLESFSRAAKESVAMVVVPFFGIPVDWDVLRQIADAAEAALIEDAAQGNGGSLRGRPLGSFGDVSIISFGRGKGWTGGSGGAVMTRNGRTSIDRSRLGDATSGRTDVIKAAVQWILGRPSLYAVPSSLPFLALGDTVYHPPVPPHAMARGAIALVEATGNAAQLEAASRRSNGDRYNRLLAGYGGTVRPMPQAAPGYLRYPVRVAQARSTVDRFRRLGVAATYPRILPALDVLQAHLPRARMAGWPGAENLVRELVTLPTHSMITPEEQERIGAEVLKLTPAVAQVV